MPRKNHSRYPSNWDSLALQIKTQSDWRCTRCDKQCLRPTDSKLGLSRRDLSLKTLTVHHWNYTPEDNRLENLVALCSACHLLFHTRRQGNIPIGAVIFVVIKLFYFCL